MAPPHGTPELQAELARIAKAIVHEGRGILAADESTGKNFEGNHFTKLCFS